VVRLLTAEIGPRMIDMTFENITDKIVKTLDGWNLENKLVHVAHVVGKGRKRGSWNIKD
jgi:hypothetical protein